MSQEPYQGQQQRNQTLSKELRSRAELRAQGPCRNRSAVLGRVPSWPAKGLVQPHTAQRPPTLPPGSVGALRSLHLITNENALVVQAWA